MLFVSHPPEGSHESILAILLPPLAGRERHLGSCVAGEGGPRTRFSHANSSTETRSMTLRTRTPFYDLCSLQIRTSVCVERAGEFCQHDGEVASNTASRKGVSDQCSRGKECPISACCSCQLSGATSLADPDGSIRCSGCRDQL